MRGWRGCSSPPGPRRRERGAVSGIDRAATAIGLARAGSGDLPRLTFQVAAIEDFCLEPGDARFDLAVAVRVGGLDGRHPKKPDRALLAARVGTGRRGRLLLDGGSPVVELALPVQVTSQQGFTLRFHGSGALPGCPIVPILDRMNGPRTGPTPWEDRR